MIKTTYRIRRVRRRFGCVARDCLRLDMELKFGRLQGSFVPCCILSLS
jgi:hypothetical protein